MRTMVLDLLKSYESEIGYNICTNADSSLGVKESEEVRCKKI